MFLRDNYVRAAQSPRDSRGRSPHIPGFHLCGWIERIPAGTWENDGLETGTMGAAAATIDDL